MIPLYTKEQFDNAKRTDLLPYKCIHCGKTFYKWKGAINDILNPNTNDIGDYCSQKCNNQHRHPPIYKMCETCNMPVKVTEYRLKTSKHIFCNKVCAGKYSSTHRNHGYKKSKLEIWLQKQLTIKYPNLEILYNDNTTINHELDIYIPSLKIAFEINGIFHYKPIYGEISFQNQINIDNIKKEKCLVQNIKLIIVDSSHQTYFQETTSYQFLNQIIENIDKIREERDSNSRYLLLDTTV